MRDTGFDNHIRLNVPYYFLSANHIFRQLDNRTTHPAKAVLVFLVPAYTHPLATDLLKSILAVQR